MDQIPSKLTPDVLKNTNIKIVHRTLAKDDREHVGATMNLTPEQVNELGILEVGQAVIHREGMDKAFLVKVMDLAKDKNTPPNDDICKGFMNDYHNKNAYRYNRYAMHDEQMMDNRFPLKLSEAFISQDFNEFSRALYNLIVGVVYLILDYRNDMSKVQNQNLKEAIKKETIKTKSYNIDEKKGITKELANQCHVVFYLNHLLSKLHHKSILYNTCLQLNRIFLMWWNDDLHFGEKRKDFLCKFEDKQRELLLQVLFIDYINKNIAGKITKLNESDFGDEEGKIYIEKFDEIIDEAKKTLGIDYAVSRDVKTRFKKNMAKIIDDKRGIISEYYKFLWEKEAIENERDEYGAEEIPRNSSDWHRN